MTVDIRVKRNKGLGKSRESNRCLGEEGVEWSFSFSVSLSGQCRGMLSKNDSPPTSEKTLIIRGPTFLLALCVVPLSHSLEGKMCHLNHKKHRNESGF